MASDPDHRALRLAGAMLNAAAHLDAACAVLREFSDCRDENQLMDELGLLVARLRKDEHWLNTEAEHLAREATRDA